MSFFRKVDLLVNPQQSNYQAILKYSGNNITLLSGERRGHRSSWRVDLLVNPQQTNYQAIIEFSGNNITLLSGERQDVVLPDKKSGALESSATV